MDYSVLSIDDKDYPEQLRNISDAPKLLYVLGNIDLLHNTSIAIVGSRKCTEYGKHYAKKFAHEISIAGITVVSGLAIRDRCNST